MNTMTVNAVNSTVMVDLTGNQFRLVPTLMTCSTGELIGRVHQSRIATFVHVCSAVTVAVLATRATSRGQPVNRLGKLRLHLVVTHSALRLFGLFAPCNPDRGQHQKGGHARKANPLFHPVLPFISHRSPVPPGCGGCSLYRA